MRSSARCAAPFRPSNGSSATPSRRTRRTRLVDRHARACPGHPRPISCDAKTWMAGTSPAMTEKMLRSRFGLTLQVFLPDFGVPILLWTRFICINESLTLDSPRKLDSNRCDSEVTWGSAEPGEKSFFRGGLRHGARTRGERVRPIRFDQGIGAVDRETCLSSPVDRGARASQGGPYPDHRVPGHHLFRRLRPGSGPEPAKARVDETRRVGAGR